ncbi:hypothetical protein SDC9_45617 [bioreactor metagenome]|uniref:GGDEF domain-containing protein n=1 Tax=bioreactor metagenome TaxID=1076179 RepID=A0A644W6L3_9ZZZZ
MSFDEEPAEVFLIFRGREFDMEQKKPYLLYLLIAELAIGIGCILYAVVYPGAPFLPNPAYGAGGQVLTVHVAVSIWVFAFLVFTAAILLAVAVISKKNKTNQNVDSIVSLALFILLAAVWIFFEGGVPSAYIANLYVMRLVSFFCFHLLPAPFLLFIKDLCGLGKRCFTVLFLLLFALYAGNLVWLVTRKFEYPHTLFLVHILIGVSLAASLWICAVELLRNKNYETSELLIGLIIFTVISAANLLLFYTEQDRDYSLYLFGLVVLIFMFSMGAARRIAVNFSKARNFSAIAAAIPTGIFSARNDEHMTLLYANESYYQMYGYSSKREAQGDGMTCADQMIADCELPGANAARIASIRQGERHIEIETREKDRWGKEMWVMNRLEYQPENDEIIGSVIDITDRKRMEEELRIREEEYRVAVEQSDKYVSRYDISTRTIYLRRNIMELMGLEAVVPDMPYSFINTGYLEEESAQEFISFYEAINRGEPFGEVNIHMRSARSPEYCWYHIVFTTIYNGEGKAISAIISCEDISNLHEKEVAYRRWRQNLEAISQDSIVCYEHNLTKDICDREEGKPEMLLRGQVPLKMDEMANYNAEHFVCEEDTGRFLEFFNRKRLQQSFRSGTSEESLEYRQKSKKGLHWVRSVVQMIEDPFSSDIRAFVRFQDIDSEKKEQMRLQTQSREDALTGLLNRSEFVRQINKLLDSSPPGTQHAFLMIDLDGFKQVNDRLGHVVGDRVLSELSHDLKALLRSGDLIGRIGGDEIMLCLKNIPYDDAIVRRAVLIRKLLTKKLDDNITITGSLGVALYPRDGLTFEALYQRADLALYQAKAQGRNRYVFYHASMDAGAHAHADTSGEMPDVVLESERNKRIDNLIREIDAVAHRQSEDERYRLIMENSTQAIMDLNLETGVCFRSESLGEYEFSHVEDRVLYDGNGAIQGVYPDDLEAVKEMYRQVRQGKPVVEAVLRFRKINGAYVRCRVMVISIFGTDEKRTRLIATFTELPMKNEE